MHLKIFQNIIFFLTTIFLFSLAQAQSWNRALEIPSEYVNGVIEHSGRLYAITDSAVYASPDSGVSWELTSGQPASTVLNTLFVHENSIYIGTRGDGIFRTQDEGQTWQNISNGLAGYALGINDLTVRGDSIYAGTNGLGVYVLNLQNPVTWTAFNSGLFQFGTSTIITSGTTLVAGIGQYVFVRPQGVAQWTDVVFDSTFGRTPLKLFLLDSTIFLSTTGGIFRGNSTGTNWQSAYISQFPNNDIVAFAALGSRLFAGLVYFSDHWIFSTDNYGTTWEIRAHEPAQLLALLIAQGRIWAGRTDGLWWYNVSLWAGLDDQNKYFPVDLILHQNFPNPFNPRTVLSWQLAVGSPVRLSIYDLSGREVAVLVNEQQPAGSYQIEFDASDLPSGVYFYRLQAGSFTQTKKLMLLR